MRVLCVGNMYPRHPTGGYELVWRSAVAVLHAEGHTVRVLTTDQPVQPEDHDEPDVHRELRWYWQDHEFPRRSLLRCAAIERTNLRAFDRHVRDLQPDVVAWWSMGGMSLSLLERARRAGLPAVAFVHDDWLDYGRRTDGWYRRFRGRSRWAHWAERLSGIPTRVDFAGAARYEFVSETTRARALVAGLALHETAIAHSGIDASLLAPAPERPWSWSLLYLGRIDPRKGIDTAVAALSHLPPQATLTVAGEGDARERARLDALIDELGLGERVTFAGACPRSALQERYAANDALLFPVRWAEPWGLVPLEAMAVGRPVVATGRGGSGEYLRDAENCLLFEAGDAAALAHAVERLAADPALRERLRAGGLETAPQHTEARFNRAVVAALTEAGERKRADPQPPAPAASAAGLRLSVVIPTLARNERLGRTLDALAAQDLDPERFEVIVVPDPQDSGVAGLDAVLQAPQRRHLQLRRVDRHAPGVGAARNAGWRAARAPLVLFLGDDILAAPDLLSRHLAWHDAHPDTRVGVLGHVRWARELKVTPFMRWMEHGLQFNYPSIDGIDAGFGHFYTANVSLKRAMLERVDGFDEDRFPFLYEDIDLGYRLYRAGFQMLYNRRARAEHLHPTTVEQWDGRMRATAAAERRWVALRPEFEAYFHDRLADAASRPAHRGRVGPALLRFVPSSFPWLGERVWTNVTIYYRQQLAPAFLEAWAAAQEESEPEPADAPSVSPSVGVPEPEPVQPGGSPPGGPK